MITTEDVLARRILALRKDWVLAVRELFGAEPDPWQARVLEGVRLNERVCMKACKGPGKSACDAWAIWLFLLFFPHSKVIVTSVTGDNLRDNLWSELAKWQKRSPLLSLKFEWSAERVVCREHPETWFASARQWSRSADSDQQGQTLAGVHADHIMFVLDEVGSIPDPVARTAEAALANKAEGVRVAKLLISGNPEMTSGPLWRACTIERHLWFIVEVTADPADPQRAPRVSLEWAQEQIDRFGRDDPWVMVNVLGKFPPQQANKLLGPDQVAEAMARHISEDAYAWAPKILGIDVARFGDDRSTFCPRQGLAAFRAIELRKFNTMAVADRAAYLIDKWQPEAVFIDVSGGLGAGPYDRLEQLGYDVQPVEFGGSPNDERFQDKRSEMHFALADWVKKGGCLPNMPELAVELCAPIYSYGGVKGKFKLEPKDEIKKRIKRSPDLADGYACTFAQPVAPVQRQLVSRGKTQYDVYVGSVQKYDPESANDLFAGGM